MKAEKKRLNECFIWIVLFLVCMVISVFYMLKDYTAGTASDEGQVIEQAATTEEMEQEIEDADIPSGTI